MGKQAAPRRVADNEALAVGTTIRGSAQKLNLVAALIRGRKVEDAMNILAFSKKAMAVDVRKVLASAIANAENNHNLDVDTLVISEDSVGKSLTMKRVHARGRGKSTSRSEERRVGKECGRACGCGWSLDQYKKKTKTKA